MAMFFVFVRTTYISQTNVTRVRLSGTFSILKSIEKVHTFMIHNADAKSANFSLENLWDLFETLKLTDLDFTIV